MFRVLRFVLLRFLPRRLVPVLLALEVIQLIRGWRKRNEPPVSPPPGRRTATADEPSPERPEHAWADRTD
jgi:hypothetical protein